VDGYLGRLPLAEQSHLKDHVQAAVLAIGMCQRTLDATDPERATIPRLRSLLTQALAQVQAALAQLPTED
jgi:hypothetical protein